MIMVYLTKTYEYMYNCTKIYSLIICIFVYSELNFGVFYYLDCILQITITDNQGALYLLLSNILEVSC